jgi:hypothetical protein
MVLLFRLMAVTLVADCSARMILMDYSDNIWIVPDIVLMRFFVFFAGFYSAVFISFDIMVSKHDFLSSMAASRST